ncbi:DUF6817 domain-containing protein [Streptomyces sp. NPDC059382]|uniref:DUF6817 domain-containing protein n=1 Tax=Streptomyces sp. NPDC059382 TaxID=3346816 RepID=UPI0036C5E0BD
MPVPTDAHDPRAAHALARLRELGAAELEHPGGTLLAHLVRVRDRLAGWGARPELRRAGLCHAFYGTDGFPSGLLPVDRRTELAAVIGPGAEELVYFYASCDRGVSHPTLADVSGPWRDRFTGRVYRPGIRSRRDFAELSAANELDLADHDPAFRAAHGPALRGLFERWAPLLSEPARRDCGALA